MSIEDIGRAMDYFHQVSYTNIRKRSVANVEPGQPGYVLNRTETQEGLTEQLSQHMVNFRDIEGQVKDFLKRAGYKQPNLVKDRGPSEVEAVV